MTQPVSRPADNRDAAPSISAETRRGCETFPAEPEPFRVRGPIVLPIRQRAGPRLVWQRALDYFSQASS